jgi:hypothetical protein
MNCDARDEPATLTERGLSAIQSPRKLNGLSHGIFECLIVKASSQAQYHLSVLADRYTEGCRGVFDCTGDGQCDNFGSGSTGWPRHFGIGSGPLLPKSGVVGRSLVRLARFHARSDVSGLDQHAAYPKVTDFQVQ